jgi:hypothetical protein
MMRIHLTLALTATLLLAPSPASAQAGDAALLDRLCPDSARRAGLGALVGRVRNADDDAPLAGVAVVLRWDELGVDRASGAATSTPHTLASVSDGQALYRFCALPRYTPLVMQAQVGDRNSGAVEVRLADEPIFVRPLSLSLRAATADTGAAGATLVGEVVTLSGQPVRNAQAQIDGAAGRAATNDTGVFVLARQPTGTQTLVVRALGYLPKRVSVELRPKAINGATIVLDRTVQMLDSVRVLAKRYTSDEAWLAGFEQRKRATAGGTFLGDAELTRHNYAQTSDLFRNIAGLSVSPDGVVALSRGAATMAEGRCVPALYVDNMRLDSTLDILSPRDIKAVEIYRGPGTAPPEYNDLCGAIVIWTR